MSPRSHSHKLRLEDLAQVEPLTENQVKAFKAYENEYSLVLAGSAGTGKTFMALLMALEDVLDRETPYEKLVIVRSIVPTRDIGFLPGNEDEKKDAYTGPYRSICAELFGAADAWDKLVTTGQIEFLSTSFIRGMTLSNCVIVIDEMQNLNFHELDSVITRVGQDTRFIMCGDYYQSDFQKEYDKNGILKFLEIVERLKKFKTIEFGWEDIVRSDFVRDYIMTKELLERNEKKVRR
jgi:predicted ribonuclease YlaK